MSYPDMLIRGIFDRTYLDSDGTPGAHLFYFKQQAREKDDFIEQSINWYDNSEALDHILRQEKEPGKLQFQAGAAILLRSDIDHLCKNHIVKGKLAYERDKIPGNDYHGNLLLRKDVPTKTMKKIAAYIALYVQDVVNADR